MIVSVHRAPTTPRTPDVKVNHTRIQEGLNGVTLWTMKEKAANCMTSNLVNVDVMMEGRMVTRVEKDSVA